MSKIGDFIRKLAAKKNSSSSGGLGTIFLKPSEATPSVLKSITSSGNTATVVSGSVNNIQSKSYVSSGSSGGSGGGYVQTSTPSQTQYNQERERQRQAEKQRQDNLKKIADEKKRQEELKKQSTQRAAENKKLRDLSTRANIEKKNIKQQALFKNSTIKEQLAILKQTQAQKSAGLYIPPTDKFGKTEAFYVQQQAERDIRNHVSKVTAILQKNVNDGSMSLDQANKILNQEVDRKYNQVVAEIDRKYPPAKTNYKLDIPVRERKEKFVDKVIAKLEVLSGKRRIKADKKGQELIANRVEFEKLMGLVNQGTISDKDLARIQGVSRRRIELTLSSFGNKAVSTLSDTALGLALLTKVPGLVKTPEGRAIIAAEVIKLPASVKSELKKFGVLYRTNPEQAGAIVVSEILFMKGAGAVFKKLGKVSKVTINRVKNLSPTLLKIERGLIKIKKPLPSGEKLTLKFGTIADVQESVAVQFRRGGKQLIAVTAQADKVIRGIRRKAIIRKPFSFDEAKLSKVTRDLLKKFDKANINPREVITLNRLLREETKRLGVQTKGVDLLERSMYFDPDRTLRKSRLAAGAERVPEDGTLFDLLTGEASLFKRTPKPAVYVIEEFAEKLPKTKEFASIIRKIKAAVKIGKDPNVSKAELAKLTRWQVTPSGKLKGIGSTTYQGGLEREVTIAPGEVIKKVKKLGTLKVGDKRIPIYAIKIIRGKQKVSIIKRIEKVSDSISQLRKRKSKLKTPQAKKNIEKKIQIKIKELDKVKTKTATKEVKEFLRESRRRPSKRKKTYPVRRKAAARAVTRARARAKPRARARPKPRSRPRPKPRKPTPRKPRPRKTTPRKPTPRKPTPRKPTPRKPTPRKPTPRKPVPRKPRPTIRAAPRGGKKKPIVRPRRGRKKTASTSRRKVKGYNVYVKSRKKYIKATRKPLSKKNAQDRRAYVVDHSTSARAKLRPVGRKYKSLGKIRPKEAGARNKIKARNYRIVKGKRVQIRNTIIERKGKPRINTRGEKRGLSAAKLVKELNKPIKKKTSSKRQTRKKKR